MQQSDPSCRCLLVVFVLRPNGADDVQRGENPNLSSFLTSRANWPNKSFYTWLVANMAQPQKVNFKPRNGSEFVLPPETPGRYQKAWSHWCCHGFGRGKVRVWPLGIRWTRWKLRRSGWAGKLLSGESPHLEDSSLKTTEISRSNAQVEP